MNIKIKALASFLSVKPSEIEVCSYDDDRLSYGGEDYIVLTDEEADDKCEQYILETAWAFRKEWLMDFMSVFHHNYEAGEKAIAAIQDQCETGNDAILALIDDRQEFVSKSIQADGRGHFLAGYDFNEHEEGDYFIYRNN
jgi:hypothetical protein